MRRLTITAAIVAWVLSSATFASDIIPASSISYQGKLTSAAGVPVPDALRSITFTIYDAATAGNVLWQSTASVQVSGGLFSTVLGPMPTEMWNLPGGVWLQTTVGSEVISPRTKIERTPMANLASMALGVTDRSVTSDKISSTGGLTGQVLTSNGTGVIWATPSANADLLDSINSTQFMRADQSTSTTGNLRVNGDTTLDRGLSVAGALSVGASGSLTVAGQTNTGMLSVASSATISGTVNTPQVDAGILRDRDDVSYTLDPNGSSRLNNLTVAGTLNATINPSTFDSRYILKTGDDQTFAGDIINTSGGNFKNPIASTTGCISTQVFSGPYYYGPDATSSITIGQSNPVHIPGSLQTPIFYDRDNTSYYVDPASSSVLNDVRASILFDRADTSYYVDPSSTSIVNDLRADKFSSKQDTTYYVDPDGTSYVNDIRANILYDRTDNSYYLDPAGTSVLNDVRAGIFYDRADTGYYVDPNSTSNVNNLTVQGTFSTPSGKPSVPIAYGSIKGTGVKSACTLNVGTVTWASGYCQVHITGVTYSNAAYVTTVTTVGSTPLIATTDTVNGDLKVMLYNLSGVAVSSDFQFVIYKP